MKTKASQKRSKSRAVKVKYQRSRNRSVEVNAKGREESLKPWRTMTLREMVQEIQRLSRPSFDMNLSKREIKQIKAYIQTAQRVRKSKAAL